ncbi:MULTISPECIES: hypothetical protein [Rhodopseudomonas]|uniref:hypothetical protein n=1 Tax=Rhodopseudomonas TaxID=1073 RepID=UPI00128C80B2|nr:MULTISPECIES: hypothetical protein [Rhodopseudomonas]WOK19412.1 hypothetical protein RBJ75_07820 [Rhodopseudomonas sp. BAL398]
MAIEPRHNNDFSARAKVREIFLHAASDQRQILARHISMLDIGRLDIGRLRYRRRQVVIGRTKPAIPGRRNMSRTERLFGAPPIGVGQPAPLAAPAGRVSDVEPACGRKTFRNRGAPLLRDRQ